MHAGDQKSQVIEEIGRRGWRQGAVIAGDLAGRIFRDQSAPPVVHEEIQFMVLSHDCDVVHHDLIAEPNIEIISFKGVTSPDGNLLHGKNPRRLHMPDHSGQRYFEFHAKDRRFCDRRLLAEMVPDPASPFSDIQIRSLIQWIALRYVRTAFPDAFNNRLKPAAEKLNKLLKAGGMFITSILVAMDMRELADGETYNLILYVLVGEEDINNALRKNAVIALLNQIESIIDSNCKGINVSESFVQSENMMSIADFRLLYRLEFDHLSQSENGAVPIPRI